MCKGRLCYIHASPNHVRGSEAYSEAFRTFPHSDRRYRSLLSCPFLFLTFRLPSNALPRYFEVVRGSADLIRGSRTSSEMSGHLLTRKLFRSYSGCVSDELRTLFHFPLLLSFINNYLLFSFPNFTHYCLYFTIRFPTLLSLFNN